MFTYWVGKTRVVLGFVLLALVGTLFGMSVKAWILPKLPAPLARFMGIHQTSNGEGESGEQGGRAVAFWKSSMIPNFVSPRPGTDPMGMELIPVYKDEMGQEKFITLSHATMQNIGLRTAPVIRGTADRMVRTVGQVDYAEPLLGDVTLKMGGWVEDLMVNYVGQRVKKGQSLFTFYSPDLQSAQEEYLISLQTDQPSGVDKVFPAYDKLRFWDVPKAEIEAIKRSGKSKKDVTFVSPFDGWVIEKEVLQGMYMKPGSRYYRIADLSTMWVYVYIYEYQLAWVREGQLARLTLPYDPGQVLHGKVIYVYPHVDPKTRQIRVRLEFPNPQLRLKAEMYANVEVVTTPESSQLLVPLDAVIYNGRHKVINGVARRAGYAFVQVGHGKFEPREAILGEEVEGGRLQILSGLDEKMEVVVCGQFLLESERKVKESNLKMLTKAGSENAPEKPAPSHIHP